VPARASSRLAAKQQLITRGRDLLEQRGAEPPAGHCGDRRRGAEQLGQPFAALTPLARERDRREPLDVGGMGVRVAPHRVAARGEFAHSAGVEEPGCADQPSDDEEVTAHPAALQRVGDPQRAGPAVVESQRHLGPLVEQRYTHACAFERIEMALERLGAELVAPAHGAWKPGSLTLGRRDHVVVAEDPSHGATRA